ncbi:MAG: tyrosine--tRNA ligase [Planctomycetes bacterium]|nr:tyrosine--tRNA ligase [Planctomycetota bacterium]
MKSSAQQLELIKNGTDQIVPADEFLRKLDRSISLNKPLRVKYGIDPTGIDVHLGHTVPLRKLKLFQDLGHQAVLIIGNYTALVGDPSGRDQARQRLTEEQVAKNALDYLVQVGKVIDLSKTEVRYNGEWFSKYRFLDVLSLAGTTTLQRMLERDDFTKRYKAGTPIYLHECLYPLMQGHDSVEVRADVELGGSEQLFSLMAARDLQKNAGQEPQVCITLPILRGLDGTKRMGKSLGNYIGVGDSSYDQFAKIMSIPDELMKEWFQLLTSLSSSQVGDILDPSKTHPLEAKKTLGKNIVGFYHGDLLANEAAVEWTKRFSQRQDPTDIPQVVLTASQLAGCTATKLLVFLDFAKSNNDARRLIQGGGVTIGPDKIKINDPNQIITIEGELIVRVGARRVVRAKSE